MKSADTQLSAPDISTRFVTNDYRRYVSRSSYRSSRLLTSQKTAWGRLCLQLETAAKAGTLLIEVRPEGFVGHRHEANQLLQCLREQFEAVLVADVGPEARRQASDRIAQIRRWSLLLAQGELERRQVPQSNFRLQPKINSLWKL